MPSAWLFGTRHDSHGLGPNWTHAGTEAFLHRCAALLAEEGIGAVAEEVCSDAIREFCAFEFGGHSALGEWCRARDFNYAAFDLNEDECTALGIPSSLAAAMVGMDGDAERADALKRDRFERREEEWVRRLTDWGAESMLIVIGADHVESLGAKLEVLGWQVQVADRKWIAPQ